MEVEIAGPSRRQLTFVARPFGHTDPGAVTDDPHERVRLMRRVAVTMFVTGGTTALLGVEITARTQAARWTQASCGLALIACGVALLVVPPNRRVIQASVLLGITFLGALIAGANPMGMASLFYLWPMAFAAYFSSQRFTAWAMAWSVVTLGVALRLNPYHDLKVDTFVGTTSSVGLMTALVSMMTHREARLRRLLAETARLDPLTGLLNRRAFDLELHAVSQRARARGRPVALVMFDLDHFKQFNDRHGHLAGDDALRQMAAVLRTSARDGDAVGRFGGEEFTVVLSDADLPAARAFYDRVAQRLAAADDPLISRLTISAGISVATDAVSAGDLFALADRALYVAKADGRARCVSAA